MRVDRLNLMEEYIIKKGVVSLPELAKKFQVSVVIIRRDIKTLLNRGKIIKVYGGVASVKGMEIPLANRLNKSKNQKSKIGELAARLVQDHSAIFLDAGTTTPHIIPHLAQMEDITIVTHNLLVLYEASKYTNLKIINLGGAYNHNTASYEGYLTLRELEKISLKTIFIGSTGISLEHGLTNDNYFEAEIKTSVARRNAEIVLLADHMKFGHVATVSFLDISDLDVIVTDSQPPKEFMDITKNNNVKVIF